MPPNRYLVSFLGIDSTAPSKQASVMSEKAGGKTRAPSPLGSAAQGSVLEVVFENSPPPLGIVVPGKLQGCLLRLCTGDSGLRVSEFLGCSFWRYQKIVK